MGFLLPSQDFAQSRLNVESLLITHPSATFYFRVESNAMQRAGIAQRDLLIVDRSLTPTDGSIVLATIDGSFLVRSLAVKGDQANLTTPDPRHKPIPIHELDCVLWGVVTFVIKAVRK